MLKMINFVFLTTMDHFGAASLREISLLQLSHLSQHKWNQAIKMHSGPQCLYIKWSLRVFK